MELHEMEAEITALKHRLAEHESKKRADSAWTAARKQLRRRIEEELDQDAGAAYKITDGISAIARPILGKRTAATFTEADIETINGVFDGFVRVLKSERVFQY
ncbi:MAG: hypothetical protein FWD23_14600 [Oscillospiraceae bacterium]|nr:hypothetical protein [Oscillospiraceae bacterium]